MVTSQKVEYMASLNLVTRQRLKELESRRGERRRRSTAVPQFSYVHGHVYPLVMINIGFSWNITCALIYKKGYLQCWRGYACLHVNARCLQRKRPGNGDDASAASERKRSTTYMYIQL